MIADTLNYCCCTGISYAETLTGNTVYEGLTACSSVKCYVSDDDIIILLKLDSCRWIYDELST